MAGTGIRNRHKIGSYLMRDDESGFVEYRENMRMIWDGTWRHKSQFETRQPQEFVRALSDPKALRHIRPEGLVEPPTTTTSTTVGGTSVLTPIGPAWHIFNEGAPPAAGTGIGSMIIGGTGGDIVFEVF